MVECYLHYHPRDPPSNRKSQSSQISSSQQQSLCTNANKIEICSHQLLNPPPIVNPLLRTKNDNNIPEPGSLEAATSFWNHGILCFDMDVVTLQDGTLLASHPSRLAKSTNGAKAEDYTLQEIRDKGATEEAFPLLSTLLDHFATLMKKNGEIKSFSSSPLKSNTGIPQLQGPLVNIDLKGPSLTREHVGDIVNQVHHLGMEKNVIICATELLNGEKGPGIDLLQMLGNDGPMMEKNKKNIPLGLVLRDRVEVDNDTERIKLLIKDKYPNSIQALVPSFKFNHDWFQDVVESAGISLPITAWTVDKKSELRHAIGAGVSAVVSNTPVQLQRILNDMKKECHIALKT